MEVKLIKLTRKLTGEQVLINPYRIIAIEGNSEGSSIFLAGKLSYSVRETPDEISNLVYDTGWNRVYNAP